jgi:hypothetical protein
VLTSVLLGVLIRVKSNKNVTEGGQFPQIKM